MAIHMSAFAKIKYDFEQRAVGVQFLFRLFKPPVWSYDMGNLESICKIFLLNVKCNKHLFAYVNYAGTNQY